MCMLIIPFKVTVAIDGLNDYYRLNLKQSVGNGRAKVGQTEFAVYRHCPHEFSENFQISDPIQ